MSESAWILRAVSELRQNGSWTGRTHLHKLLYMADRLLGVKQPFEFELYRFGPYSYALDDSLRLLEGVGLIEREQRREGYGPSYGASSNWRIAVGDSLDIGQSNADELSRMANSLGDLPTADLEVIATCLWAIRDENILDDAAVIQRVLHLKPRYTREFVEAKLAHLRKICRDLAVAI